MPLTKKGCDARCFRLSPCRPPCGAHRGAIFTCPLSAAGLKLCRSGSGRSRSAWLPCLLKRSLPTEVGCLEFHLSVAKLLGSVKHRKRRNHTLGICPDKAFSGNIPPLQGVAQAREKKRCLLPPPCFARYIAASARFQSSPAMLPSSGNRAMPMLALSWIRSPS